MAAIRLHPVTKKPSVYWYEPNGKKRQKTFEISKMLGHTSIKTTFDVYGHLL